MGAVTGKLPVVLLAVAMPVATLAGEPVHLVRDGASRHCIFHPPTAAASVRTAAVELQDYVHRASGARLPVVTRIDAECAALVRLGERAVAEGLPADGYRIFTRGDDIHIAGDDTRDGERTPYGGVSTGTRNGVYGLLEDAVGVRWLMPGAVGEDVPVRRDIVVSAGERVVTPAFENRRLPYVQNSHPLVQQWLQRQRQGFSLQLNHGHNFQRLVRPDDYDQHPEWFAQAAGQRARPAGNYKLETTDPALVRTVALRVADALRYDSSLYSYSLSPSDSGGWSTSPESLALYDRDPHGRESVTPLVLDFYRKVASQVGAAMPDRALCGYVYAAYLYPPSTGLPPLPGNLCLVLAPHISYGYGLYRDSTRRDLELLLASWSRATPLVAYYDLPVSLLQSIGAPNPPGLEILAYLYPRLVEAGMRGVYMYGVSAWGHGALTNYLLARLNWNPRADVAALAREFFERAYGPAAAVPMAKLYTRLDAANRSFHRAEVTASYRVTPTLLQQVYVPLLPEFERLFRVAQRGVASPAQRQRLYMFQLNMHHFLRYLRDAGLTRIATDSPFGDAALEAARPAEQLAGVELALAPAPVAEDESAHKLRLRMMYDKARQWFRDLSALRPDGLVRDEDRAADRAVTLRGPAWLAVLPVGDGAVELAFGRLSDFGENVHYRLYDPMGVERQSGAVVAGSRLEVRLQSHQVYLLEIIAGKAIVEPRLRGAVVAAWLPEDGLHLHGQSGRLQFLVPRHIQAFSMTLRTEADAETAALDIRAPDGSLRATLDTSGSRYSSARILAADGEAGVWDLMGKAPRLGVVDDVWLSLDAHLAPWLLVAASASRGD